MGTLSNYSSAAFAAPVLLRACTHTHPDPTKRSSSPASFRFDELLQGSPKLEWLLRFLVDVFAGQDHLTERVIIFADSSHSRRILYHFFEYVVGNRDDNGRDARLRCLDEALFAASVPTIAGTTTPSDTAKALSQFASSNSESPVLIATSSSGGRGHNAPCTSRIVFWDVPPSSRAWLQCIYRGLRPPRPIHRTLYVHNLVMRDTVEEGYYTARWARAGLSDALVPQGDLGATRAVLCAQREMLDK
jgi:ERCC4-related helicase